MKSRNRILQRKMRTRSNVKSSGHLRLSVFRSNKYIYAQIIDDSKGVTLVGVSETELKKNEKVNKTQRARKLGAILAEKARSKKIKKVVFDRGSYKYHGRVRELAEGAREGGLEF